MRSVRWLFPEDAGRLAEADTATQHVLDLSAFAHPSAAARAAEALTALPAAARSTVIPLLPPEDAGWWDEVAGASSTVALDGLRDGKHAAEVAARVASARVVVRLRGGRSLHHAERIVRALRSALGERLAAIWYAPADLLVDFRDDPDSLYVVDLDEARLAAPSWVRSRCLTVARAYGLKFWGQLDVSFERAPPDELAHARRLAEASGFDVLVEANSAPTGGVTRSREGIA